MRSVLFVCTANICRSAMAEGLMKFRLANATGWRVESAGTWTVDGQPPAPRVLQVMRDRGIDVSAHRSRNLTGEILNANHLILTMEHGHLQALKAEFPASREKIYLLYEMVGQNREIVDPIGGSLKDFVDTAKEIDRILMQGWDKIGQLAQVGNA